MTSLRTPDVCIIGAGPAGLSAALSLGRAGRRVVLLESGSLQSVREAQELNAGEVLGEPYKGLVETRHRQVGGTVNIWNTMVSRRPGARYVPLDRLDTASWPIGWDELAAWYTEAQRMCGLGPFEYRAESWGQPGRHPFSTSGSALASAVYQFGTADHFTAGLVGELRRMDAVDLIPSSTAVQLDPDTSRCRIHTVRAVAPGGTIEVQPCATILACGAIENARLLLLASRSGWRAPALLGHGFMEHPRDYSMTLTPTETDMFGRSGFYDMFEGRDGTLVAGHLVLTEDARRSGNLPNAAISLFPQPRLSTQRGVTFRLLRAIHQAVGIAWRGGYGWSRVRRPDRTFEAFNLVLNLEQKPSPLNRIELGNQNDRFGNPLPRLVLHWTPEEQAGLESLRQLLVEAFRVTGLGRLEVEAGHRPDLSAHHHAGTTRMAECSKAGVVDANGRVFGLENLYVTGASVFPTAGYANPMLTIVAMALRLADHLHRDLG